MMTQKFVVIPEGCKICSLCHGRNLNCLLCGGRLFTSVVPPRGYCGQSNLPGRNYTANEYNRTARDGGITGVILREGVEDVVR